MKRLLFLLNKLWHENIRMEFLISHYVSLARQIVTNPRLFILWPITIAFIVSYPALYSIYTAKGLLINPYCHDFESVMVHESPVSTFTKGIEEGVDLEVRQLWIQKSFLQNHQDSLAELSDSSALEKDFLVEALQLQNRLIEGIQLDNGNDNFAMVHSPLQIWNNSPEVISDSRLLKRVHSYNTGETAEAGLTRTHSTVFSKIVKVNSMLKSADALLVSLLYKPNHNKEQLDAGQIWDKNLAHLASRDYEGNSSALSPSSLSTFLLFTKDKSQLHYKKVLYIFTSIKWYDNLIAVLAYSASIAYFILSLSNIHSVKSRVGLLVAFSVEMLLSIMAGLSLTSYIFETIDFHLIPLQVSSLLVIIIGMENMLGLVATISKLPEELPMGRKLSETFSTRAVRSSFIILADVALLIMAVMFAGQSISQFCILTAISISMDHFLHLTYFTAVLTVDLRRLDLEDLLRRKDKESGILPAAHSDALNIKRQAPWSRVVTKLLNGPISVLPSHNGMPRSSKLPFQNRIGARLIRFRFPVTTTMAGFFILFVSLICINARWISSSNSSHFTALNELSNSIHAKDLTGKGMHKKWSLSTGEYNISISMPDKFAFFLDNKDSAVEVLNLVKPRATVLSLLIQEPIIAVHKDAFQEIEYKKIKAYNAGNPRRKIEFKDPEVNLSSSIVYRFDIHYLLEFVTSLVFICSVLGLLLKLLIKDEDGADLHGSHDSVQFDGTVSHGSKSRFQCRDLVNGHFLDVIKVTTSSNPFIISVGMDHKIFVWSPVTIPSPPPTELPLPRQLWPVTDVVMSDPGHLIAVFSKSGTIKCWSRLSMSWCWSVHIDGLRGGGKPLEAFFRKRTPSGLLKRKKVSRSRPVQGDNASTTSSNATLKGKKKRSRAVASSASLGLEHAPLSRTLSIDSTFDRSNDLKALQNDQNYDFIVVLKNGKMYTVSSEDGSKKEETLSPVPLITADKIISPRVNDRLVCNTERGSLVVATTINNAWKVRNIAIQEKYNSGTSLYPPQFIPSHHSRLSQDVTHAFQPHAASRLSQAVSAEDIEREELAKKEVAAFFGTEIATVSFVGMIVRTRGLIAELIDAQTGTLLKRFNIGQFKPGTFKVFHSTPVHCRFCGSASVSSFSLCYTEVDTSTLIMQTFSIDNRAKNNICLRVERDPRETRCLGFESVAEHQHWLENVERWCVTDLNMVLGIRKKQSNDGPIGSSNRGWSSSSAVSTEKSSLSSRRKSSQRNSPGNTEYHIDDVWEGFSLSANGKVGYYEIPNNSSDGLLIKSIGPVVKFGNKAIVAGFGNILKVLYTGGSNLFDQEIDTDNSTEVNLLGFINRRKRMNVVSYQMTHSTDFGSNIDDESI